VSSPRRLLLALAFGLMSASCDQAATQSTSVLPSLERPLPSSAISEDRAIRLAREHSSLTTFVSAAAGRFADLNADPNIGPGFPVKADDLVWAVTFTGDMTICNPLGACPSPRPGTVTVFLDYQSGAFRTSESYSRAN
jgi:hypothetical protein